MGDILWMDVFFWALWEHFGALCFLKRSSASDNFCFKTLAGPGPVVNSLTRIVDICAWRIYLPGQILLRLRFQSVGISTSNPWCRRFVRMLPSRFRSSWFCPPTFRTLASSSQEDMAVAPFKASLWDDFRWYFWGRVVDPCQGIKVGSKLFCFVNHVSNWNKV